MAEQQWVLVHKESGQEFVFSSRSEYVNTKTQGGYRDKKADEPASSPQPEPRRPERARREPVNDQPTVEHPAQQ